MGSGGFHLYLDKLMKLHRDRKILQQPRLHHIRVSHGDWCPLLRGIGERKRDPEVNYIATEGRD
jgi:hypothetical protein